MSIQIFTKGHNMCRVSMAGAQMPYIFQLQVTLDDGEMYVAPSVTNLT